MHAYEFEQRVSDTVHKTDADAWNGTMWTRGPFGAHISCDDDAAYVRLYIPPISEIRGPNKVYSVYGQEHKFDLSEQNVAEAARIIVQHINRHGVSD